MDNYVLNKENLLAIECNDIKMVTFMFMGMGLYCSPHLLTILMHFGNYQLEGIVNAQNYMHAFRIFHSAAVTI